MKRIIYYMRSIERFRAFQAICIEQQHAADRHIPRLRIKIYFMVTEKGENNGLDLKIFKLELHRIWRLLPIHVCST